MKYLVRCDEKWLQHVTNLLQMCDEKWLQNVTNNYVQILVQIGFQFYPTRIKEIHRNT